jgi:DNA-binding beta-propeller fold protein YncE
MKFDREGVRMLNAKMFLTVLLVASSVGAEVLYAPEGNRLRRYDLASLKSPPLHQDVLIQRAGLDPERGRDINGMVCMFPDGSGRFIAGEDTGQPSVLPGWGVFAADGTQIGKLTATYFLPQGDPFGCAFDSQGRLFTTEIGNSASGAPNGQLIMWFPPYDRFPGEPGTYPNGEHSAHFCKISSGLGTSTSIAIDEHDRVYVTNARGSVFTSRPAVVRFSPPYPTSPDAAGGCGQVDALGSPVADEMHGEPFVISSHVPTPTGIARAHNGNWYVASVLNGVIAEFDSSGVFVRRVLSPPPGGGPPSTGNPQGIAVDADGDLYYADLQLTSGPNGIGPGPNGKVRWIDLDAAGTPSAPMIIRERLAFPDALGILPGSIPPCTEDCPPFCPGDCNGSTMVTIDELTLGVTMALRNRALSACAPLNTHEDARISIGELVAAVAAALNGCPES